MPWVESGGQLQLELELRSDTPQDLKVRWGNPAQMGGLGESDATLAASTDWQTVVVDFECEGWLAWFSIRFPAGASVAYCRRATLRKRGQSAALRQWRFA